MCSYTAYVVGHTDARRGSFRLFKFGGDNDGRPVCCWRSYISDRTCKDDKRTHNEAGRRQRTAPVSSCYDSYIRYWGIRQQHGYGSPYVAYRCEPCCQGRHKCGAPAHAVSLCQQPWRYADAYRYAAQPCYSGRSF